MNSYHINHQRVCKKVSLFSQNWLFLQVKCATIDETWMHGKE